MARVSADEVRTIMDLDPSITDPQIDVFITQANLLVTRRLGSSGLDSSTLKEIERNVAAHLLTALDPQIESEKIGEASTKYAGRFGEFLRSTRYGQAALLLDTTGILAKSGQKSATISVIDYSTS